MNASACDWYRITCLTHLHAGRGDTNYDIVDKEVQRDPLDTLPTIHASSLKGALREWFRNELPGPVVKGKQQDHETVNEIFGNDTKRGNSTDFGQGTYQFFEGRLLALPVRCNNLPFMLGTSVTLLTDCLDLLDRFGIAYPPAEALRTALKQPNPRKSQPVALTTEAATGLMLDEFEQVTVAPPIDALTNWLGYEHVVLFHHDDLRELAGRLPVIARNNLENGRSVNLWYEEIVPRQSRFSFFVRHPKGDTRFATQLAADTDNPKLVQIGANATIGYGLCTLSKLAGS